MAINENAENVRILSSVGKGIEGLRRRLQDLQPELSTSASEAANFARQELCISLIGRLVIAERRCKNCKTCLS